MREIIEWAKQNAKVTHESPTLVVGRYHNKRFRIFLDEGDQWAGVWEAGADCRQARACYNLDDFLSALRRG